MDTRPGQTRREAETQSQGSARGGNAQTAQLPGNPSQWTRGEDVDANLARRTLAEAPSGVEAFTPGEKDQVGRS